MSGENEAELREILSISADATLADILAAIRDEGWTPHVISETVEGRELHACPIVRGIFQWIRIQTDPEHPLFGQKGYVGRPTPEHAALDALAVIRGRP